MNESLNTPTASTVCTPDPLTLPSPPQGHLSIENGACQSVFSQEEVNAILAEFQPIIRKMAGALVARNPFSLDIEDLASVGTMGLLSALRRYDPTREIKFRTFAEYRIRGMMLDEIRAMDWVPRSVRSRQDQIRQTVNEYLQKTGATPTNLELAHMLGIEVEELEGASGCAPRLVSLDEPVGMGEEGCTLGDVLPDAEEQSPFWDCVNAEMKRALEAALVTLSPRQEVLQEYYYVRGDYEEIGLRLGLTESESVGPLQRSPVTNGVE
ncbi:MAG: sigma-70 family RNA polymerase sigma factor [Nitrospirales bacterium]|nr:sigma-70 family RNA polymerase sigma factor [Nitrospirales bacterium]